jgi:alpha-D-ribose 1-methylphosphonate 5-triphosphate synthase subunit PhnL
MKVEPGPDVVDDPSAVGVPTVGVVHDDEVHAQVAKLAVVVGHNLRVAAV